MKIGIVTSLQGIMLEEIPLFIETMSGSKSIFLEGVSTLYANIEDTLNSEYAQKQLRIFKKSIETIKKFGLIPL